MVKRSWEERRRETNARYYQKRKAQLQAQQPTEEDDAASVWL